MTLFFRLRRSQRAWIIAGALLLASVAQAFPLLLVSPAIEVLTGVMTMKNFVAASLGVHAAVALIWGNKDGSVNTPTTSNGGQITVYIDPKKPLVAPAGWTEAPVGTSNTGSNPQPSPPPNTNTKIIWSLNEYPGTQYPTGEDACKAYPAVSGKPWLSYVGVTYTSSQAGGCNYSSNGVAYNNFTATSGSVQCPPGYAMSNGQCTLNDPSLVKKPVDGNCAIVRSNNSFGADPLDPDCPTTTATMPTPSTIQLKKNNEIMEATINGDGSVTTKMTGPDGTGNTESTIVNFEPPKAGLGMFPTGTSNTSTQGTGDLNNPNAPVQKMEHPTDYSREATLQSANTKLGQINDSLNPTGAGPDTSLTSQKNDHESKAASHKGLFDGIGAKGQSQDGGIFGWSWLPSIPTATCAPLNFGTSAYMTTLDLCPTLDLIRGLAGYAMYLGTAWALFGILTGKQGA